MRLFVLLVVVGCFLGLCWVWIMLDGGRMLRCFVLRLWVRTRWLNHCRFGELATLPAITSIAASLGAIRVAENAFKQAQRDNVTPVVLDDAEACAACWRFLDDERILVEPACGASIALAYDDRLKMCLQRGFGPDSKVVIVVCGGSKMSLDVLNNYREKYQARSEALAKRYTR